MNPLAAVADRCVRVVAKERFPIQQEGIDYHCLLTPAKRRNLTLQIVNRYLLRFGEIALPHILHVGVTTACNLRCPACPTGTAALGRPPQHLDFDVFRRTVDELRGALLMMLFWDWGEPLLHPRLADMIEYATRNGIMTVTSTNGNVTKTDEQIERLVAAQPSVIASCVDGTDQATYEKYRTGGELSKALETVRRLRRAKDRLGVQHPVIEFRSLALRDNHAQMPDLLTLAGECGADLFAVKSLRPVDYRGANVDDTLVPLDGGLSRYDYDGRPESSRRRDFERLGPLRCALPLYAPTLDSDGTLVFCCYASEPSDKFGGIAADGFVKVWKSAYARALRSEFVRHRGVRMCRTCYFRSDHKPCILHHVPLRPLPPDISVPSPKTRSEFLEAVSTRREELTSPQV